MIYRDGQFYLAVVIDVPEPPKGPEPDKWLGVDLGIVNLATDSDAALDEFRARYSDQARRRRRARAGLRLLAGGADARRRAAVPSQVVYREGAKRAAGEGDGAVHLNKGSGSGRAKVVDVVLDALLLGSCDFLIRTGSGVSMAAQAFSAPGQVVHYVHAGHC